MFYDIMTLVWAAILAPAVGLFVYFLAGGLSGDPTLKTQSLILGGIATVSMAVFIFFYREFRRK